MSLAYRILYAIGFTPWEQMADPAIAQQIAELFAREENGREAPYGTALDLGCGSGIWAVELARRGGRCGFRPQGAPQGGRTRNAAVEVRLLEGDVTNLPAEVGSGYKLLLDFGCFQDELSDDQRTAEGRQATAAAGPDATLWLLAWKPGRRGPLPRGASSEEIQAAFPEWKLIDEVPLRLPPEGAPGYVRRAEPRFYRLRRN